MSLRRRATRLRREGYPTSSNRASSFHLHWTPRVALQEAWVTLAILEPPLVPELYFWALQVSFSDDDGVTGGAHLGLQWHPSYPGSTAVNWGGYDRSGWELVGSESELASVLGNPNTRNFEWLPEAGYRLRIFPDRPGWWTGEVVDLARGVTTVVRRLAGGGDHLTLPVVWSEVFAQCDDPGVTALWSEPGGLTVAGEEWKPEFYTTTYQRETDGGCSNTDSRPMNGGIGQLTLASRTNPPGAQFPVG